MLSKVCVCRFAILVCYVKESRQKPAGAVRFIIFKRIDRQVGFEGPPVASPAGHLALPSESFLGVFQAMKKIFPLACIGKRTEERRERAAPIFKTCCFPKRSECVVSPLNMERGVKHNQWCSQFLLAGKPGRGDAGSLVENG